MKASYKTYRLHIKLVYQYKIFQKKRSRSDGLIWSMFTDHTADDCLCSHKGTILEFHVHVYVKANIKWHLSNLPIVTNVLEFSLRFLIKLEELISAKNQEPPIADCKIAFILLMYGNTICTLNHYKSSALAILSSRILIQNGRITKLSTPVK